MKDENDHDLSQKREKRLKIFNFFLNLILICTASASAIINGEPLMWVVALLACFQIGKIIANALADWADKW